MPLRMSDLNQVSRMRKYNSTSSEMGSPVLEFLRHLRHLSRSDKDYTRPQFTRARPPGQPEGSLRCSPRSLILLSAPAVNYYVLGVVR